MIDRLTTTNIVCIVDYTAWKILLKNQKFDICIMEENINTIKKQLRMKYGKTRYCI